MFAQGGAFGMEKTVDPAHEIGENVTITERSQLLSITPEQAKKIKSLRIENQLLDREVGRFLSSLNRPDSLCFYKCRNEASVLRNVEYSNVVRFLDCALTSEEAIWHLAPIESWEYVEILDLTQNDIGIEPEPFFDWLKKAIWGTVRIDKIVLSDNKFTDDDKREMLHYFETMGLPQIVM